MNIDSYSKSFTTLFLATLLGVVVIGIALDSDQSPAPDFNKIDSVPAPLPKLRPAPVSSTKSIDPVMNMPLDQLTERLARKLETNPDDIAGWTLLGRSYATLGQHKKSAHAFEQALSKAPDDANLRVTYGETLITSADGRVTPKAHKIFMVAYKIDPQHPGVRYNLALADHQAGYSRKAYNVLIDLKQEAPAGAPWVKKVDNLLNQLAAELKMPVSPSAPAQSIQPGQSAGTKPLPPEENQEAFIRSMVDRLAARMEKNPGDLEGWVKLGRSYKVLKEYDKAARAYENALALAPNNPEIRILYEEVKKSR